MRRFGGGCLMVASLVTCDPGSTSSSPDDGAGLGSASTAGGPSAGSGNALPAGGAPSADAGAGGRLNPAGSAGLSGVAGGGSAGAGGAGSDGAFSLAWQDDFDTLDANAWELENFTYDGNQATFTPENAKVANGTLTIALTAAPAGSAKPYLGVEIRSVKTLTYGKVSASMRFAKGSGVVSGLVLFYTPYPNCDWNEIDIEHLGKTATSSQFNAMVFTGTPNPTCTTSVSPTQDPLIAPLGFDAEADFHVYDIEWTPAGVKYIADGVLLRTWTKDIALLKQAQNILLTIWASNAPAWAGAITDASAPTTAELDWIKVYDWNG
ncbi:MAG: family 16 glycosylhydrolase [Polyangiaceae bacterium]